MADEVSGALASGQRPRAGEKAEDGVPLPIPLWRRGGSGGKPPSPGKFSFGRMQMVHSGGIFHSISNLPQSQVLLFFQGLERLKVKGSRNLVGRRSGE